MAASLSLAPNNGVGVLDMIAILQAMKANGAIQADIEVM